MRRALERLGPTFVKAGQLLSTRPDILPESYLAELRKLQDEVPPVPFDVIRGMVERELDGKLEDVFASFDETPLAAASIGQVHAAVLPTGEDVVVKVQRPDIRDAINVDLDILQTQARFVAANTQWGRQMDVVSYATEISSILHGELDYVVEGRNAERFATDFDTVPDVRFPVVYWDFTTQRVLTLERFYGIKLDDIAALDAGGYDRALLARRGVEAYLKMVFDDGFYHADPHPGNIFVCEDGSLGFTDFGRVGIVSGVMEERLSDLFIALVDRDDAATLEALIEMGVAPETTDERAMRAALSRMFARYYDTAIEELHVGDIIAGLMQAVRVHGLHLPADYALALATFMTLEGVGLRLDPTFNLVRTAAPFARRIVEERLSPITVARRFTRSIRQASRLLTELPESISKIARRAAQGRFLLEVQPVGLDPVLDRIAELVNRLAFAVLVGSFVLGLSLLLRQAKLPNLLLELFGVVLVFSFGVGVWLFVSIFWSMWRSRRHPRRM